MAAWAIWGRRILGTVALAIPFGAAYPLIRSLPTPQCGVLHATNLRTSGEGLEFCGPAMPWFVDLQVIRFPVRLRFVTDGGLREGEAAAYRLELETSAGRPIGDADLALTHTRKVHLLIVSESLEEYHHLHPDWDGRGAWVGEFQPHSPGRWRVYVEAVPLATATPVWAATELQVAPAGAMTAGAAMTATMGVSRALSAAQADGYTVELTALGGPLRAGREAELRLRIFATDQSLASAVPMQPVMGAWAHVVAFDAEGRGLAHLHPLEEPGQIDLRAPEMYFGFLTERVGHYRFWVQIHLAGQERLIPFDFEVGA